MSVYTNFILEGSKYVNILKKKEREKDRYNKTQEQKTILIK